MDFKMLWVLLGSILVIFRYDVMRAFAMSVISPHEVKSIVDDIKRDHPFLARVPTPLVLSICEVESDFNPNAIGKAGEVGIMQVKPTTGRWIEKYYNIELYPGPLNNLRNQILDGMLFLNWLMDKDIDYLGVIHSYNVGYHGYKEGGNRNWRYAGLVLERHLRWSFA